jgi:hypothetical protein
MRWVGRRSRSSNESWLKIHRVSDRVPDYFAPFCARCRDMGTHHSGVEHLNEMRGLAHCRERIEEGFECTSPAQSPEPLPHAVPMPELGRKRTPSDVVNHEIVQGFEKRSVVPPLVAPFSLFPSMRCCAEVQGILRPPTMYRLSLELRLVPRKQTKNLLATGIAYGSTNRDSRCSRASWRCR